MVRRIGALLVTLSGLGLASADATAGLRHTPQRSTVPALHPPGPKLQPAALPAKTPREARSQSVFSRLKPLHIASPNAHGGLSVRLYDEQGRVDETSARKLDTLLADCRDPDNVRELALDRRTLQLLYRAAYHFRVEEVQVVSAYRAPGRRREGLHGSGRAIDFKLKGVKAAALAAYLRTLPRVGVGVYTHRKTQYVHLDVREHSYHWLDASPPGRAWREQRLRDSSSAARDARYTVDSDWPEGVRPPEALISSSAPGTGEGNDHG